MQAIPGLVREDRAAAAAQAGRPDASSPESRKRLRASSCVPGSNRRRRIAKRDDLTPLQHVLHGPHHISGQGEIRGHHIPDPSATAVAIEPE